jgi:hypothetical protein
MLLKRSSRAKKEKAAGPGGHAARIDATCIAVSNHNDAYLFEAAALEAWATLPAPGP